MTTFYHGSYDCLPEGTILRGRGDAYKADWEDSDFYRVLEAHRPDGYLAHHDAVFMVGHPDDIDAAGGSTEWCSEVEVSGQVTRHDMNWSSQISCLISDGYAADSPLVRDAALAYWTGRPFSTEQDAVWEYLVEEAVVVRCEPYEDFEVSGGYRR